MTTATQPNIENLQPESVAYARKSKRLSKEQFQQLQQEFDALRDDIRADLGQKDVDYMKNIIRVQRFLEIAGRTLIHFSFTPVPFMLGVSALSVSKILDNMEIGHNVMHGQYDWTNDPKLDSASFEWDTACESASWKRTHNFEHHTFTNVIGKDRDYGYSLLRLSEDTPWHPGRSIQIVYFAALSIFFQWGVALHELESERLRDGTFDVEEKKPYLKGLLKKGSKQAFKDYVFFPALAGPFFWKVMLGNALANLGRNLWASAIIFCGHFTEQAQTFSEEECANETRGEWYYRQLLGSSNLTGGKLMHIMTGHLSFQVEHHIFPDIPAQRYEEMAPRVEAICKKFDLPYNSGPFLRQYGTVINRVWKYSFPDKAKSVKA
ncbi:acyl-CoA desaturase [Ketobacter sp. MCCC 1A13808]|uniref:fatty acid desaturase family protein n=1 Tax=Ketobacter sp. MCCC 1A13808 TaxID=2602738 RepID=UPI000F272328|nr:acyl-CoA desaturase [Ketobacter sp. MCCC 1A13808]MVF14162.1 acyl-CoA desaturase [Ketobacter sp. MCCC 1A13808]RLP54071.1 MAG: acyl-CoA desaturase [Ketobacter sp.]